MAKILGRNFKPAEARYWHSADGCCLRTAYRGEAAYLGTELSSGQLCFFTLNGTDDERMRVQACLFRTIFDARNVLQNYGGVRTAEIKRDDRIVMTYSIEACDVVSAIAEVRANDLA